MLQDGKYFKVSELACHDGTPYPEFLEAQLPPLMAMLDAIREAHGGPIQVVSGYRSPAYNAALAKDSAAHQVASGSQHVQGRAADLRPVSGDLMTFYRGIMDQYLAGELPWLGGIGVDPISNWIHVDTFKAEDNHLRTWQGT